MPNSSSSQARADVKTLFAQSEEKLNILRNMNPMLIDISLRESCFGAAIGHTLANKHSLLPLVDEFGFKDKIIATLNYQLPEHLQVEDDFCKDLLARKYDMTGCFALTQVGAVKNRTFNPDPSAEKLLQYCIPNTVHEISLRPKENPEQVLENLSASIHWLREKRQGDPEKPRRIYLNILDLIDTFFIDQDWACQVLEHLASLDVDGVSFEDGRGTYFPFQIAAVVGAMKALLKPKQKVLFHAHAGNGMENASAIEALLNGADGYWGAMEKESSTIGHASLGELIANLVRAGNMHMATEYKLDRLLPICQEMHKINTGQETPPTWPVTGSNAYRLVLSFFEQQSDIPMDLPPDTIGGKYQYRIAPVGSNVPVLQGRFLEVHGIKVAAEVAEHMILLMRRDLREGKRFHYDDPDQMQDLYRRALTYA